MATERVQEEGVSQLDTGERPAPRHPDCLLHERQPASRRARHHLSGGKCGQHVRYPLLVIRSARQPQRSSEVTKRCLDISAGPTGDAERLVGDRAHRVIRLLPEKTLGLLGRLDGMADRFCQQPAPAVVRQPSGGSRVALARGRHARHRIAVHLLFYDRREWQ